MTYKGHIRNRIVVLDEPFELPEGAEVTVELRTPSSVSSQWAVLETTVNSLARETEKILAQDLLPPTPAALRKIHPLLASLQNQDAAPPHSIVPNADGGIVLEWINGPRREIVKSIEINADGQIEQTDFIDNKFHSRSRIS